MAEIMGNWPSGHGQITKIWPSDRCGGKTIPAAMQFVYNLREFGGYLGNVGLFPLRNAGQRARSHHDDSAAEEALFIDPGAMNPEEFIAFRQEYPYAIDDNDLGRMTIDALGLDREALAERRRDHLTALLLVKALAESDSPEADDARDYLHRSIQDTAEYASMARAALA